MPRIKIQEYQHPNGNQCFRTEDVILVISKVSNEWWIEGGSTPNKIRILTKIAEAARNWYNKNEINDVNPAGRIKKIQVDSEFYQWIWDTYNKKNKDKSYGISVAVEEFHNLPIDAAEDSMEEKLAIELDLARQEKYGMVYFEGIEDDDTEV